MGRRDGSIRERERERKACACSPKGVNEVVVDEKGSSPERERESPDWLTGSRVSRQKSQN
jgi:hypothetical protein